MFVQNACKVLDLTKANNRQVNFASRSVVCILYCAYCLKATRVRNRKKEKKYRLYVIIGIIVMTVEIKFPFFFFFSLLGTLWHFYAHRY